MDIMFLEVCQTLQGLTVKSSNQRQSFAINNLISENHVAQIDFNQLARTSKLAIYNKSNKKVKTNETLVDMFEVFKWDLIIPRYKTKKDKKR